MVRFWGLWRIKHRKLPLSIDKNVNVMIWGGIKMLILVGKSCSGKTTIQKELVKLGLSPIVTYTTRTPRNEEKNGVSYHFVSEKEFFQLLREDFFAETTTYKVFGGDIWHYATAWDDIKENAVLIGNPKNVEVLRNFDSVHPFVVYLDTDENVIYERIMRRKDDIGEAQRRIIQDREDFSDIENFIDRRIENNGLIEPEEIAKEIKALYEVHISSCEKNNKMED